MLLHDSALERVRTLSWADFHRIRSDPWQLIIMTLLPIGFMAFLTPIDKYQLRLAGGYPHANGVEQAGPGAIVLFAFFITTLLGASFFREHEWGTWDRLRAAPVRAPEIIAGKSFPLLVFSALQLTIVWVVAFQLFDLHSQGSVIWLALLTAALSVATWGFGIALVSICKSIDQLAIIAQPISLALGGLGGTIAPRDTLPDWAKALSPLTPQYWALKGFKEVILDGGGFDAVATPCVVLLGVGVAGALIAVFRFRLSHAKIGRS
ncbi:ABC transporter permease [Nocardia sp. CDC159]|uniref:Transport permease protein n=1 Tax=Nocardia pulmonis TaxID=2951408 RepID=A0A9X2EDV1_9NOCA|nr:MULTISPECIES: ABC transporter permease [Nocardia]MCM6778624.1 ABC transporter permease [Nocardia pulmonis]MCM6791513.1 ABC transporter permease [Nocardia sp. CDC159]